MPNPLYSQRQRGDNLEDQTTWTPATAMEHGEPLFFQPPALRYPTNNDDGTGASSSTEPLQPPEDTATALSSVPSDVPSGRRERQDRSEAAAEEYIWVQTASGIVHAAVPCHGCDGLIVKRPDSVQIRVKPKCGTIAQQMQVLEVLPSAPRFCRHKACQTVFLI